jgi:hypothetical protein
MQTLFRRISIFAIPVLVLGMIGCNAGTVQTEGNAPTRTVRGDLKVQYDVQYTEDRSSVVEIYHATSIHMSDTLIIIQDRNGTGNVIPVEKLNALSWKPSPEK